LGRSGPGIAKRAVQRRNAPQRKDTNAKIRKNEKGIFAIDAALAAMPIKPNTAAVSAKKKTTA
jgi:hypothetical protein